MDPVTIAAFATAILTPLSPYLVKAGEELSKEIGKEFANQTKKIIKILFKKSEEANNQPEVHQALIALDTSNDARLNLKAFITKQAEVDPIFAEALSDQINDLRGLLLNCLQVRFLTQDLKELYFRLGIGWNQLAGTGATDREKAIALIEEMWVSEKIPNLIKSMWKVRRDLNC